MTYGILAAIALAQSAPAAPQLTAPPAGDVRTVPQPPLVAKPPTLSLESALREADSKNFDLKAARARLEQSKELHWKAWSAYLPQVIASGTFTRNSFPDVTFPGQFGVEQTAPGQPGTAPTFALVPVPGSDIVIQKQNQLAGQIEATQAIFAPQAWYAIAAARAGERLAEDNTESARRDILFAVAQAYYGAVGQKQVVAIQERQLAIALDHERDARVRYDAGTTPKVTLLRAEIDRARAEQDLKRAQNGYAAAKVSLATLLDRPTADFEVEVPPAVKVPSDGGGLEEAALRDRPDVKAAREQKRVATRTRGVVLMRYLPTLGAFGRYDYLNAAGFAATQTTWAVGFALNWTILDGFLRESDLREQGGRVREAEATLAGAEAKAREEVRRSRLDLDSAIANSVKAKEQLDLARENQRLVNVNYKAGAATYIEVSDANTALLTAELTHLSESLNADLAALRLLKAAGAFDPR
jgi:outer membrane protein TolC